MPRFTALILFAIFSSGCGGDDDTRRAAAHTAPAPGKASAFVRGLIESDYQGKLDEVVCHVLPEKVTSCDATWTSPDNGECATTLEVVASGTSMSLVSDWRPICIHRTSGPPTAEFYLYFGSRTRADKAARALTAEGYSIETRRATDDRKWLVLARREMSEELFPAADRRMEKLAASLGGEYDGSALGDGPALDFLPVGG